MFKWPGVPSPNAPMHELADFAELICWKHGDTSKTALAQLFSRLDENDYPDSVPEEEEIPKNIEDAYLEIERRMEACRDGYPFAVGEIGNTLHAIQDTSTNGKQIIYKYLLLATRLNMNNNHCHAGINGPLLLEKLAAETSREYLGIRAESIVFGTAAGTSGFSCKVNDLCKRLGEGGKFVNHGGGSLNQKDDKLDVVAWKPFADRREGKLIAFGQCKTGTHWKDHVAQLQPDAFCSNWFQSQPVVSPVRMFFISEALSNIGWRNNAVGAGLLFDRCRIIDFSNEVSEHILGKIANWTSAAAQAIGLSNW